MLGQMSADCNSVQIVRPAETAMFALSTNSAIHSITSRRWYHSIRNTDSEVSYADWLSSKADKDCGAFLAFCGEDSLLRSITQASQSSQEDFPSELPGCLLDTLSYSCKIILPLCLRCP